MDVNRFHSTRLRQLPRIFPPRNLWNHHSRVEEDHSGRMHDGSTDLPYIISKGEVPEAGIII